jgi:hypothetical protein
MDMILDYSGYLEDKKSSTSQRETTAANPLFLDKPGWCPFCKATAQMAADEKDEAHASTIDEHGAFRSAWQCPCGWWQTYYYDWRHDSGSYWDYYGARNAILRQYDASDSDVAVASLRRALVARPNLIDMVSRKKTEELVGSIFADHFDCEVRMVGKSHDKGIDLVLVRGDKVIALVQVKGGHTGGSAVVPNARPSRRARRSASRCAP